MFGVFSFAITEGRAGIRRLNLKAPCVPVDNKSDHTIMFLSLVEIGCCEFYDECV